MTAILLALYRRLHPDTPTADELRWVLEHARQQGNERLASLAINALCGSRSALRTLAANPQP